MGTSCGSNGFYIIRNRCVYNGKLISSPPNFDGNLINLTNINNKIYLNGYEYFPKQKKWKRTFKAIWHYVF